MTAQPLRRLLIALAAALAAACAPLAATAQTTELAAETAGASGGLTKDGFVRAGDAAAAPADAYAPVSPGRRFSFPADHGAHPDFRIEWWYVTATLAAADGRRFGAQWTLFRQAMTPGGLDAGWTSRQFWMAHAAVTAADAHFSAERFARGGVGQAGVAVGANDPSASAPFEAWIDDWSLAGGDDFDPGRFGPLRMQAADARFAYDLRLAPSGPVVLQGDDGYSRKTAPAAAPTDGAAVLASYYYSQPFFEASGALTIDGETVEVTGLAWLDREWSSEPLGGEHTGWDWFSLHFDEGPAAGAKAMLYRFRHANGGHHVTGNWITRDGRSRRLPDGSVALTPIAWTDIDGAATPTRWRIEIAASDIAPAVSAESAPLNARAWMTTSISYWEGPVTFEGQSHSGRGYLEMTSY